MQEKFTFILTLLIIDINKYEKIDPYSKKFWKHKSLIFYDYIWK